ncbi:nucleoside phosphorylase [Neobacillus vireti]|uniref:Uridine phosphorylase n=1 Tax=Neobacillus vireti LMG 21834 TaxID=1131730 RepID=A0AB94IV20_9BACI|nr:nucleoside phosphorylase [Neobacillus vireti]ETI70813.1 uridine phosphorylase [Neobacillus vireti LMG 21834]KLT17648.1 uridine phosphorylase [Neobacillus vireti]
MTINLQPHIRIGNGHEVQYALLPGDPGRVDEVAKFLDQPEEIAYNREYKTIKGFYKGIPVLVTSTGIGGVSAGIAIEELKNIGIKVMIRIGSCGALQPHLRLGDLVIASGAVRNDGASYSYINKAYPAIPHPELLFHVMNAAKKNRATNHIGIVRCHDSFYTDKEQDIDNYWSEKGILASDMETAALFVIGGLRGIKTASILNVVVEKEGDLEGGINDYIEEKNNSKRGEEFEILTALEAIVSYDSTF